jgi:hypothetical protein
LREAAHRAADAVAKTIGGYADGTYSHEVPITGALAGILRSKLKGKIEGLTWSAHVMESGTGSAAEETPTGADLLVHVQLDTPRLKYSKGLLIQAKRVEPDEAMKKDRHDLLLEQCKRMLKVTQSAFVFDYTKQSVRCGSARVILDSKNRHLFGQCPWTPYRFFLELFRCMIGDGTITSSKFDDLIVPHKIRLLASGDEDSHQR